MARDAAARLYGVDHDSLKFTKLDLTKKYDQATIEFTARPGMSIDLYQLHESLWATRLSGGTRSGCISLQVTVVGEVAKTGSRIVLTADGGKQRFLLESNIKAKPNDGEESALPALRKAVAQGKTRLSVTGYVEGWAGRWPNVLRRPPDQQPRLMVTGFGSVENEKQ